MGLPAYAMNPEEEKGVWWDTDSEGSSSSAQHHKNAVPKEKKSVVYCAACRQPCSDHDGKRCDMIMLDAMLTEMRLKEDIADVVDIRMLNARVQAEPSKRK
jgi:hypothetical protein